MVANQMPQIIAQLIELSQITCNMLETWEDDIEEFQNEEDMYGIGSGSVRAVAQEALTESIPVEYDDMEQYSTWVWAGVQIALTKTQNWQIFEAVAVSLVNLSGILANERAENVCVEQFKSFRDSILLPKITENNNKWLTGRLLMFAGKYVSKIENSQQLINACSDFLATDSIHSKIFAIRALQAFIENLEEEKSKQLEPCLEKNISEVLKLASKSIGTEVLNTCLEILIFLLDINPDISDRHAPAVTDMLCHLLQTNTTDPLLAEDCLEVLEKLLRNKGTADKVVGVVTPVLMKILTNQIPDGDNSNDFTLLATAIESIEKISRGSRNYDNSVSVESFSAFLEAVYIPACTHAIKPNSDSALVQNLVDASKAILSTSYGAKLLMQLKHDGKTFLEYTFQLISYVLSDGCEESAALSIGKLILSMISKCGSELQANNLFNPLLTECLKKLQSAQTLSVQQSLLLVFGQLMCENLTAVLQFLQSVNATEFYFKLFVEKYPEFFGFLERKIATIALTKILEHAIATSDQSLLSMQVQGDEIFSEQRVSRSAAKNNPKKYQMLPLPVKIYKLLIQEFESQLEKKQAKMNISQMDEFEESFDDEDDENPEDLLDYLGAGADFLDDGDDLYDEVELRDNPFASLEVMDLIPECLKKVPHNDQIGQALTPKERATAQNLGFSY